MIADCGFRNNIRNMNMNADEMKKRTRAFALRIVRLVEALPKNKTAEVIGKQLLRCGTSVGANYRASCRARSQADFIAKMGIVEEEADESIYWIELLVESGLVKTERVSGLLEEADQIVAIVVSSIRTARGNK
jgi:four helix bundle protein